MEIMNKMFKKKGKNGARAIQNWVSTTAFAYTFLW
jgi:hypothetical protein